MLTSCRFAFHSYSNTLVKLMRNSPQENQQNFNAENIQPRSTQLETEFLSKENNSLIPTEEITTNNSATILIVDDNPNNLQVLFSYLEKQGFKVLLAQDGASALQIAQFQHPDLILLDILMPELDGFATCSQLKAQPATQDIPVIFLTALSETANIVQGFKLGGVDYITKPIAQEEVLARIQTHLNLEKMRLNLAEKNKKLQRALDFEALIRRITNKIRDSLDESYSLQTATVELTEVLDLSGCQIELYNSQQTTATIAYEYTKTLPPSVGKTRIVKDFPQLYQQLLQKIPLQLVEKFPLKEAHSTFSPVGIELNRLACPIFDDNGIIGNLWGLKPASQVFTNLEIQLIQQVAAQCAIAIRQARLYETANQQVEELGKLNQLKDDFLKTITHELKAPMSSIQLATETMKNLINNASEIQKSPTFHRVFTIFNQSCKRQKQLVEDLLTLCYLDAKAETITLEWIDLNCWLPDLTQLFLRRAEEQQQELILDLFADKLMILTDPMILERIVQELLNNACKYTPKNATITLQTKATDKEIVLSVSNTGVEIPATEQALIFNQFYRIPNNDPWQYGGTGLGLTLVKKLTEILNASISVASENQTTVFSLKFPKS